MAITDLTGTKWKFIERPSGSSDVTYSINFRSSLTSYEQLRISIVLSRLKIYYDSTSVYANTNWPNEAYRTIEITGGADATNATLISWIESNAENIPPQPQKMMQGANPIVVDYAINDSKGRKISDTYQEKIIDATMDDIINIWE